MTRLLGFECITSELRSTGQEREREFCGPRASTEGQAFTGDTVSKITFDGGVLNYCFQPVGRCTLCLPGGSLLGCLGDVRGERPWSRQAPGCVFKFYVFVQVQRNICCNQFGSMLCLFELRVWLLYILSLWYVRNICTAAQKCTVLSGNIVSVRL